MIDFHTHILPQIDDGSSSIELSKKMLEEERDQGVTTVCLTPHFYAQRSTAARFIKARNRAFKNLQALKEEDPSLPDMILGAEVAYFPGISEAHILKDLCFTGTKTLLLEMPYCKWDNYIIEDIKALIFKRGFNVVLAHLERYAKLKGFASGIEEIYRTPFIIQINAGSIVGGGFAKRRAIKMIKEEEVALIASDCHNMGDRKPNIKTGYELAEDRIGPGFIDEADVLAKEVLGL